MFTKLLFALALFSTGAVFAADSSTGAINYDLTERFYQAHAAQIVAHADPTLSHFAVSEKDEGTTLFDSSTSQFVVFGVEYGISEMLSVYAEGNYGTDHGYGYTKTGFSEYDFGVKANWNLNAEDKIVGRFGIAISPGNQSEDSRNVGANVYSLLAGYQHRLDADSLLAVSLEGDFTSQFKQDDQGQTYTFDAEQYAQLFVTYERNLSGTKIGGELGLIHVFSGGTFPTDLQADIYANFAIIPNLSIGPRIAYMDAMDAISHKNNVVEQDNLTYQIIVRYAF